MTRTAAEWRLFLDRLLLWSGSVALAAAVIFFVAHNWDRIGKLGKFALLQALVLGAVLAYWRLGPDRPAGKAALSGAAVMLGALLAFFGQTYQTGADTWELFANWAALILPWALVGQFAPLWVLWIAIVNVAITLYFKTWLSTLGLLYPEDRHLWALFAFNSGALVLWELAARRFAWFAERWAPRLLALAGGAAITMLALHAIFDWKDASPGVLPAYPLWAAALYFAYRRRDLFMLAGGCLSLIVVAAAFCGEKLTGRGENAFGYLLVAILIVAMGAGSAWWLKQVASRMEHERAG